MKIILFLIIFYLTPFNVLSAEKELSINGLLEDGYKIIKQDTISTNESLYSKMIFTLKKRSSILICSFKIRGSGNITRTRCEKP
tara:strand:+ start:278 stop:529 length:252 start_codon:yes stop_codon:yes gene_type:complete